MSDSQKPIPMYYKEDFLLSERHVRSLYPHMSITRLYISFAIFPNGGSFALRKFTAIRSRPLLAVHRKNDTTKIYRVTYQIKFPPNIHEYVVPKFSSKKGDVCGRILHPVYAEACAFVDDILLFVKIYF